MPEAERKPNLQLRRARGDLSQAALAEKVNVEILRTTGRPGATTSKSISDWERGWYTWPRAYVRDALCQVLGVADAADLGFHRPSLAARPVDVRLPGGLSQSLLQLADDSLDGVDVPEGRSVEIPGGRSFRGAELSAQYCATGTVDGSIQVSLMPNVLKELGRSDRRTIVIARASDGNDSGVFLADGRELTARLMGARSVEMPVAYRLDDLTIGVIWAVSNSDAAILADDGALERYQQSLAPYDDLRASSATLNEAPQLNDLSRQWLGSRFCSRHIFRHLARLSSPLFFWTREQRGEEAASWLLWTHKLEYLRHTTQGATRIRRGFCVPEHEVRTSPRYERVLLLLAVALMEACGIEVQVSSDPELGEIEGFVLADRVIVANWLRAPGLWYVDTSAPPSRWATYRDVSGLCEVKSVIAHETPLGRLQAMSAYIDISWNWFVTRSRELATAGVDGLAHPRSRLLSTEGLTTALRYVASLDHPDLPEGADIARR